MSELRIWAGASGKLQLERDLGHLAHAFNLEDNMSRLFGVPVTHRIMFQHVSLLVAVAWFGLQPLINAMVIDGSM